MQLQAYGEMLPDKDNYCRLDDEVTDAYGLPALRIHVRRGANEQAMRKDMAATAALRCCEAAGAEEVQTFDHRRAARHHQSRDGHRPHGARSGQLHAERLQPEPRCTEPVRYRWRLHDIERLPEPITHISGADRTGL